MALNNFSPLLIIYDVFGCRKRHMNNLKPTYHLKVEGETYLPADVSRVNPCNIPGI